MCTYSDGERINAYRDRFKAGPVGTWTSCQGTFDMIMSEEWIFRPDGTGEAWSNRDELITRFRWRSVRDLVIEMLDLSDGHDEPTTNRDDEWQPVEYDFSITSTDYGLSHVTMAERSRVGSNYEGFYLGLARLELVDEEASPLFRPFGLEPASWRQREWDSPRRVIYKWWSRILGIGKRPSGGDDK